MSKTNLRKAAVFVRSLDAQTAATMLAQLSNDEAAALREAIRGLGPIDPEEQADIAAEFRRIWPIASEPRSAGVDLQIESTEVDQRQDTAPAASAQCTAVKRFEFLEQAPIDALVPYLAREHAQTIAVVLSYLAPPRAAAVLAALPEKTQADTFERILALGETDPDSVVVVERELAAWLARRPTGQLGRSPRSGTATSILAAADPTVRNRILANLRVHNAELANDLVAPRRAEPLRSQSRGAQYATGLSDQAAACAKRLAADRSSALREPARRSEVTRPIARLANAASPPAPGFHFDNLIHLDGRVLAAVVRAINPDVLILALAGCKEELMHHVCRQVPKRMARTLRRELRRMGPTRLSDLEAAQRAVSTVAAQQLSNCQAGASALVA